MRRSEALLPETGTPGSPQRKQLEEHTQAVFILDSLSVPWTPVPVRGQSPLRAHEQGLDGAQIAPWMHRLWAAGCAGVSTRNSQTPATVLARKLLPSSVVSRHGALSPGRSAIHPSHLSPHLTPRRTSSRGEASAVSALWTADLHFAGKEVALESRRNFLKKALYVTPLVLTAAVRPSRACTAYNNAAGQGGSLTPRLPLDLRFAARPSGR